MAKAEVATETDLARINAIVSEYSQQRWALIPLLQKIQNEIGYIPPPSLLNICSTEPRGRRVVRVCRGTACHVRGGKTILRLVKRHLGIEEGQTTPDLEYTLETVACIGVCALAPNMVVSERVHGHLNPKSVEQILRRDGG